MINFKEKIADIMSAKISEIEKMDLYEMLESPKHTEMGDYAFPCFRLAKIFRKAPNMIADDLAVEFKENELFEDVTAVNGYVNFKLDKGTFAESVLETALKEKDNFGATNLGQSKPVVVEFSSVNIAKPFHMGHIRSTMIGNALYNIYKFIGYDAIAINHLGDYGTQFGKLIVAYKLWGDKSTIEADPIPELLKIYVKFHEEAEKNPDLDDQARGWFTKLENGDEEAQELWTWFREVSLKEFNRVYGMLGVHFDSYAGESFYSDKMPAILEELRTKDIVEKSDGAEIVQLEDYSMPPALITKKDGSSLYMTRDLAAAKYRKDNYDFYKNIYVVGATQQLHFKQWFKIIELMGYEWSKDLVHVDFGQVSLEGGSLSTRQGRVVFLEDVLKKAVEISKGIIEEKNPNLKDKETVAKQIGIGAVVFQELYNNRIKDYTFSWDKSLAFDGETGPYVQYTHARACSVVRKAGDVDLSNVDYSRLDDEISIDVVRLLNKFNDVVIDAANKYEPSLITRYVVNVAQAFNRFYHDNSILVEDAELMKARLALVMSVKQTIKNALSLIGLGAPEQM